MAASDDPKRQAELEAEVGHPDERFAALTARIQDGVVRHFRDVETEFLALLWTMDRYRAKQVVPRGMGKKTLSPDRRLEGIYRGKGNYFSAVMALVLGNKTTSQLASRRDIMGFSQTHQIDIAWPARDRVPLIDPFICAEAKLTGAPAFENNEGRGAMDDWSNRRKELKFQAMDLKLYRHVAEQSTIQHWDIWRRQALPYVYSLWAARLRENDKVGKMIEEARVLTDTYCDGVGIYAFQQSEDGTHYEPAPLPKTVSSRVTSLDAVLDLISGQIAQLTARNKGQIPGPVIIEP